MSFGGFGLKSIPPVDNEVPESRLGPLGRLFVVLGAPFLVASEIDQTGPRPVAPEPGTTAEYGKYLGRSCLFCHGDDLSGGEQGPSEIVPPNITQGAHPGAWSEGDFIAAMRTGVIPDGFQLDSEEMPWKAIGQLTDDELKAVWLFMKSVPPITTDPADEHKHGE